MESDRILQPPERVRVSGEPLVGEVRRGPRTAERGDPVFEQGDVVGGSWCRTRALGGVPVRPVSGPVLGPQLDGCWRAWIKCRLLEPRRSSGAKGIRGRPRSTRPRRRSRRVRGHRGVRKPSVAFALLGAAGRFDYRHVSGQSQHRTRSRGSARSMKTQTNAGISVFD